MASMPPTDTRVALQRTRRGRFAFSAEDDFGCHQTLVWLLVLHLPIVGAMWAWADGLGLAGGSLIWGAVGLLGIVGGLVGGLLRTRPAVRAVTVRVGLLLAATATVALHGLSLTVAPYVAVTAFVLGFVPFRLRRRVPEVVNPEDEVLARLDDLNKTKDELLAVVSHEFRTPLTGVLGYAKTMSTHLEDLDEGTLRLFVESIEGQSRRLAHLVDNLVATSRPLTPDPDAVCDLHAVTAAVMAELNLSSEDRQRVQLSLRGRLRARIGEESAHRVLLNLLDNAVKFADPDTLVRFDVRPQGGDLVIDVISVGPPIPADLRERLYEPFAQGDSSDTRKAQGLGLGLHVVRRLVEAHDGRVELLDGNGLVTFRVRLKPAPAPARPVPAELAATAR